MERADSDGRRGDDGPVERRGGVRLFVEAGLAAGAEVALAPDQAHYLRAVMRRKTGDNIRLFNGRDGEWRAAIRALGRGQATAAPLERLVAQAPAPDLWLLFAPLKAAPTGFVATKATELGVSMIQPVLTRFTQTRRVNIKRLRANAIEAAEQCGRLDVPEIAEPVTLAGRLGAWPEERLLLACDPDFETPLAAALAGGAGGAWAIFVGPEGGLAGEERAMLTRHPSVRGARLGPRILRAETAALAALACWQAVRGDWNERPPRSA